MASNTSEGNKRSTTAGIGHGVAKFLGIKLDRSYGGDEAVGGGGGGGGGFMFSMAAADAFIEDEPTSVEWIRSLLPDSQGVKQYFVGMLPFLKWITRYNFTWLAGDAVAGITVGAVVVPQSMAYAALALLSPEFGLYSSFMGVLLYWLFATSKDIVVGTSQKPVAVMSTLVGNIITRVNHRQPTPIPPPILASALAVICGAVVLLIGLTRCGWIVDFIPLVAISAFMTGSAITIATGQVPALLGITGFNTRDVTYKVFINILKHLGQTKLDASIGLTALATLYFIRWLCEYMSIRQPNKHKTWFFMSTLRTAFVILFYTLISWLVNKDVKNASQAKFRVLGKVPAGFKHVGPPVLTGELIKSLAGELPAAVMVLLIEQIAIAKSFGRANNYTINPSQELAAIGVTNILGPFLGAFPVTASFSGTAINSKAGVRTPLVGLIIATVVLLAINALSKFFFFIPRAALSAVIIHAVGNFITPPDAVYRFWRISPVEMVIFFAGVIATVFASIENGIYVTVASSAVMLLFRAARAKGRFLGKVTIHSAVGDRVTDEGKYGSPGATGAGDPLLDRSQEKGRTVFIPMDHQDGSNPEVEVQTPYPGIFIYRFSEGFNYPNANPYLDYLIEYILKHTRQTTIDTYQKLGDRPWNDPGPRSAKPPDPTDDARPTLLAVILDLSAVNNVDVTSMQNLTDARRRLDRHAAPDPVEWHFACVNNRWTRRALASAGFGVPTGPPAVAAAASASSAWRRPVIVAETAAAAAVDARREKEEDGDEERGPPPRRMAAVYGLNRPFFHVDVAAALRSAVLGVEQKPEFV
ncbi:hypothetical protein FGG08_007423 [Glutinoglossum americanum]|uniref:STAS domain-containing protein n=1 Tax=Glutinoglossum americanum TaxID=1670608 RepID=A0A9P8L0X8_9PEZI|nr:hypothetical protein FGG08_007423 [Glutinoglossum americanum]